jgi:hypothetical protein
MNDYALVEIVSAKYWRAKKQKDNCVHEGEIKPPAVVIWPYCKEVEQQYRDINDDETQWAANRN